MLTSLSRRDLVLATALGACPNIEDEPVFDRDLPIVDAHHHLWQLTESNVTAMEAGETSLARAMAPVYRARPRYLLDEYVADAATGHNIRASVFVDAHAMYRVDGPPETRSVGEVEFANGVAAVSASGLFGDLRVCAGIVGNVDLRLGERAEPLLEDHLNAAPMRYRGIRCGAQTAYDEDATILRNGIPHLLGDRRFREGFALLRGLGLSFDVFVLEPQLRDVIDLARAFPETQIILNHLGCPIGIGRYAGRRQERFPIWRDNMRDLAKCSNVAVKLGGLGTPIAGFSSFMRSPPATSEELCAEWRPYIETGIEDFGVDRCMFESNFPDDSVTCRYQVLWNAFKRVTHGASPEEKTALFAGTAARFYRLDL